MDLIRKFKNGFKAVIQLGFSQTANYLAYQIGLRSGLYHLQTIVEGKKRKKPDTYFLPQWFFAIPEMEAFSIFGNNYRQSIISEADEIVSGRIRLFGGELVTLNLSQNYAQYHWTIYERGKIKPAIGDIKYVWEPARFDWAITLGKAYQFTQNEIYLKSFQRYLNVFTENNPPNFGPNWQSGQEVSLRMINLVISSHLFKDSSDFLNNNRKVLCEMVEAHACRIVPTIAYAKAQNNNHLLSEAVGLFTAGAFLNNHPKSKFWKEKGFNLFYQAIQKQIDENGEYVQHSTNYHRMMLMLSLWMDLLLKAENRFFKKETQQKLALANKWLIGHLDELSGKVANLGHNDGSNILRFSNSDYSDFRSVIQASSRVFLSKTSLPSGNWDDLCLWLSIPVDSVLAKIIDEKQFWLSNLIGSSNSWASIRIMDYSNRPAHADQLHVEIWHNGENIARDAGTYLYNAASPWSNSLASTTVHNTISINSQDQMTRGGRFLWLDWAQAKIENNTTYSVSGMHDGYIRKGILHSRKLESRKDQGWLITDHIKRIKGKGSLPTIQLNWLVQDWPFTINENSILFNTPTGQFELTIFTIAGIVADGLNIIRAGKSVMGKEDSILHGWFSPTYGLKIPALSILYTVKEFLPIEITTRVSFMA